MRCGVPRFTLMALVGAAIERGESHNRVFELLGVKAGGPSRPATSIPTRCSASRAA